MKVRTRQDSADDEWNIDVDDDGRWITTENGHKVHLNEEGDPDKGHPKVIEKMTSGGDKEKKKQEKEEKSGDKEVEGGRTKTVATTVEQANGIGKSILGDIYERHRIENSLASTPRESFSDGSGGEEFAPFKADYGKLSVETANTFNDTIDKFSLEFDTTLQKVRMMDEKETFRANIGSGVFASVWHDYETDGSTLTINPIKCADYGKLAERIKELSEAGYCAKVKPGLEGNYVPTHEFGHTLVDMITPLNKKRNWVGADYKKVERVRKEINSIYTRYISEIAKLEEEKKFWSDKFTNLDTPALERQEAFDQVVNAKKKLKEKKISVYSMANADEFIAESFANEMIGEKSNPYGAEVMKVLREAFGRKQDDR